MPGSRFARTCFLPVADTDIVADDAGGGSFGDRGYRIIHRRAAAVVIPGALRRAGGTDSLP